MMLKIEWQEFVDAAMSQLRESHPSLAEPKFKKRYGYESDGDAYDIPDYVETICITSDRNRRQGRRVRLWAIHRRGNEIAILELAARPVGILVALGLLPQSSSA